jgi:hypothetical protein
MVRTIADILLFWFGMGACTAFAVWISADRPLPESNWREWTAIVGLGPISLYLLFYYVFKSLGIKKGFNKDK